MANVKIKYRRVAAAATRVFDRRDIRYAVLIDEDLHNRVIDAHIAQIPCPPEKRYDANSCLGVLHLKQRRIWIRTCSIHCDSIQVEAQRRQVQSEVLQMHASTKFLAGLLLHGGDEVLMKRGAINQHSNRDADQKKAQPENSLDPESNLERTRR